MSGLASQWSMVDIRSGHLILERCHHCGARNSYFTTEPGAPAEEYRDGKHYWHPLLCAQAVLFNLRNASSGQVVDLSDMIGLMLSTCEDPDCAVGHLALERGSGTSVYVAMCGDPTHTAGQCVSDEGIAALNEYFNQRPRSGRKRIEVVPCQMCDNVDLCPGVIIADTGLIDLW